MTYAQEKSSRFVTWPTALLLIVNVLGSNAANFSFPYQSMAWTVALPPSQLQLRRIWRLKPCVLCQWGYTHLMSASPAWVIPYKSVLLEQIAWPTQIRVRKLESTRLWSCFKPDLASYAGFNTDYKWKQWEEITSPVSLNICSTGSDESTKGTSAPMAFWTDSKLRYFWKKS